MDWNWFYSTIAQSTAALVGVFGAFLISYLISLRQDYQLTKREIFDFNNIIEKKRGIILSKKELIEYYNFLKSANYLNEIGNSVFNDGFEKSVEEYFIAENFSEFETREDAINRIKSKVDDSEILRERRKNG